MTLVILLRHAHSTANAAQILAGRTEVTHLSPYGKKQARGLVKRLGLIDVKTVRSSPLIRCGETIKPWLEFRAQASAGNEVRPKIDEDLIEVDYGSWSGREIKSLSKEPLWKVIQNSPSKVTFPSGESMSAMQNRAMSAVERALRVRGKGNIVLVSHGDVLKSIIAGALNMPFDDFQRIVVDPASISILDFSSSRPRLLLLNDSRSSLPEHALQKRGHQPLIGGGSGIQHVKESRSKSRVG